MTGTLIGVGVGPGDPELLTLKALRLIREAPVVAYPQPDDGPSFARAIVAEHLDGPTPTPISVPVIAAPPLPSPGPSLGPSPCLSPTTRA